MLISLCIKSKDLRLISLYNPSICYVSALPSARYPHKVYTPLICIHRGHKHTSLFISNANIKNWTNMLCALSVTQVGLFCYLPATFDYFICNHNLNLNNHNLNQGIICFITVHCFVSFVLLDWNYCFNYCTGELKKRNMVKFGQSHERIVHICSVRIFCT